MSFVIDQIHRIDAQLDRLQLGLESTEPRNAPSSPAALEAEQHSQYHSHLSTQTPSARVLALQAAIRGLAISGTPHNRSLQSSAQVRAALHTLSLPTETGPAAKATSHVEESDSSEEEDLEWLLVSKATTQVYGAVLKRILDQAVDIGADIWYWDEVLSSRVGTLLYSVQIWPWRLCRWSVGVWEDVQVRAGDGLDLHGMSQDAGDTLSKRWGQFYGLVRDVVRERSVLGLHRHILGPVTRIRTEIRMKQVALRKIRARNANALGVLLGEGLANECGHGESGTTSPSLTAASARDLHAKWKTSVGRNVALMEAVLAKTTDMKTPVENFDSMVAELTDDDPLYAIESHDASASPREVAERLNRLLTIGLHQYVVSTKALLEEHGKPSRWVRYWLPVTVGVLCSGTVLRMLVNRQAQMLEWFQDLGTTVVDFWTNWVVEPTKRLIKTIRHDEGSEISIMSKRSLQGDRESLERMVVDFAIDNPTNATSSGAKQLSDVEITDIRARVAEGDLSLVLRAYEKDLTSPLLGALRGNLIRALLIQIQKTKVDVELAMQGIDTLLKSQELLIGFISLTPGVLVAWGLVHYLRTTLFASAASRRLVAARRQGVMVRQLRNIDRILSRAQPTEFGELLYKDQGLLICEVHVLRQAASRLFPGEILREFGEEAEELCDVRVGVKRQRLVEERIRWAYARWMA